jgi:hypothetical protein
MDVEAPEAVVAGDVIPSASAFDLMLSGSLEEAAVHAPMGESPQPSRRLALDLHSPSGRDARANSALEWIALVLAIIVAPLGLILGIIVSALSSRSRGFVSTLARSAVIVGVIFTVLSAAGGVAGYLLADHAAQQQATRVSSQALCASLATKPGTLADPAYGWPAVSSIPAYTADATAYQAYWQHLQQISPIGVQADVAKVATASTAVVTRITTSRVIDHDRDYAELRAAASGSGLPAWVSAYCK